MPTKILNPPYVQVALDIPDWKVQQEVLEALPKDERLIIEAGTPLVKRYGIDIVDKIKKYFPDNIILADLKTLDVGEIEVDFTYEAGADAAVCSGLANSLSDDKFIHACNEKGIISVMDLMEVYDPIEKLKEMEEKPDVIIFHRAIDAESAQQNPEEKWKLIPKIKKFYKPDHDVAIAVAGGINPKSGKEALEMGADILIVGRYITGATNVTKAAKEMLAILE
jgi:bifunctional enzyme Fae/Hps